jgi:hypothetical protein
MSRAALIRSITSGLAVLILFASFALGDQWLIVLAVASLGGFWLAGQARCWRWTPPFGLSLILVTGGALLGKFLSSGLALAVVLLVLTGWDLDRFTRRLGAVENIADPEGMEKRHLFYLLTIWLVSLFLGATGLLARVDLGLWSALFLMALAILGFSQLIGYLRRSSS